MKTERIRLAEWEWNTDEAENCIDIPWPKVQKILGVDQVKWLLSRPPEQCQLVVDTTDTKLRLVAEFYDDKLLVQYHLMWAK